jgi:hypothetical protein
VGCLDLTISHGPSPRLDLVSVDPFLEDFGAEAGGKVLELFT